MCRGGAEATGSIYTAAAGSLKNDGLGRESFLARKLAFFRPPYNKRRLMAVVFLGFLAVSTCLFASLYTFHHGFRRTVQFWSQVTPMIIEHKYIKFKSKHWDKCDEVEHQRRMEAYHQRTAPKAVDMIMRMGGIYVKMGQMFSTMGSGILEETYVTALRPLQDGLPPRDYEQISSIIEKSTGQRMQDMFASFDEKPIGSASIAQAHRATLLPTRNVTSASTKPSSHGATFDTKVEASMQQHGEEVIVKVQYPEVAQLFNADLNNLELVTKLFMPKNLDLIKALRERHEKELDFSVEAQNLQECTTNMQSHGVEPKLVRIPRVRNETGLCTENVLVMEYLRGTSLAEAIEQEQTRVAKALGQRDASELRSTLAKRMREHFQRGGGEEKGVGGERRELLGSRQAKLLQVTGPFAARVLRTYAGLREGLGDVLVGIHNGVANTVAGLSLGVVRPALKPGSQRRRGQQPGNGEIHASAHVNLAKVLKTLVHVHGLQMLKDGVYNADPHPGNVLVLPDGRLGLLDYGMVGRLTSSERENIAQTVVALSQRDKASTARIYREGGYKATFRDGNITEDDNVLHRFATLHLDKIDFTPITLQNGERHDVFHIFQSLKEVRVPDWIQQARRLGRLLMGVTTQAARPISLSKEWEMIAKDALRNNTTKMNRKKDT